jgi:transposase
MAEFALTLTAEERAYLAELLKEILKETRVEEHRTRTPLYRQNVVHKEDMVVDLLRKLGHAQA